MKVFVKLDDGTQMILEVERYDTVLSVKDKIPDAEVLLRKEELILSTIWSSTAWGYFKIEKVLRFKDQILEDFRVLADYEIENNDTLQLVINEEAGHVASNVMYQNPKKPEFITVFAVLPNGKRLDLEVDRTLPAYFIAVMIPDDELIPTARQILKPMIPKMKTAVTINVYFRKYLYFDGQALLSGNVEDYNIMNNDVIRVTVDVSWEEDSFKSQVKHPRGHQPTANPPKPASQPKAATSMTSNSPSRSSKCAFL